MSEWWCNHGKRDAVGCAPCRKAHEANLVFGIVPYCPNNRYSRPPKVYKHKAVAERVLAKRNDYTHVVRSFPR